jgi:hypothetical protein
MGFAPEGYSFLESRIIGIGIAIVIIPYLQKFTGIDSSSEMKFHRSSEEK